MLYRLYTERINLPNIKKIVSSQFDGFTLTNGEGYWRGESEESLIIEIVSNDDIEAKVINLAKLIKLENNQESVLLQVLENSSIFI